MTLDNVTPLKQPTTLSRLVRFWWALWLPALYFVGANLCLLPYPRAVGNLTGLTRVVSWYGIAFSLFAFPFGLFLLLGTLRDRSPSEKTRLRQLRALSWICLPFICFIAARATFSLRYLAFACAAQRGEPIIVALAQYRAKTGTYPDSLDALIGEYLPAIPSTGLIGYPRFEYQNDRHNNRPFPGEYDLRIPCPMSLLNFDRFIYWPSEEYSALEEREAIKRLGNWVYLHE